jgi:8-oxo-dGTP diphosphatase
MPARQVGPRLTVDGIILFDGKLVCVRRAHAPFEGQLALPGGFVELGETVEEAVVREVREETGLVTRVVRLVGVYSDPARDPRGHTVTVVFALEPTGGRLKAGDDAADVVLVDPDHPQELAFDHSKIVADWRRR